MLFLKELFNLGEWLAGEVFHTSDEHLSSED